MRILITIFLFLSPIVLLAQLGRDSVLVNERTMDRPLIVHDRQLRITGGYNFSTITNRFDDNGDKVKLTSTGTANFRQSLLFDLKYGFRELLQLNVALNHVSNTLREQPINIISTPGATINETHRISGLEDLFVGVDFLIPRENKRMDVILSVGATLPIAKSESDRPSHVFSDSGGLTQIDYRFNENRGLGVIKTFIGAQFKYRWENFAVSTFFNYGFPIDESEGLVWNHRLNSSNEFEYSSRPFAFSPADSYTGGLEVEYQLYPWINIFMDAEQFGTVGGWTEETGNRIALSEEQLTFISPGVEILLTTKVWLRQRIIFPIAGENTFSPFSVQTALLFNFFPF